METVNLTTESFLQTPAMNVGVSHAVLEAVARGDSNPTFRLHQPDAVVAFGMADRIQPGYHLATGIAQAHGFAPLERLAGGRAAVFHEGTLAFSWALPEDNPHGGIALRFQLISGILDKAFRALGLDSKIGQVPGEYCPGDYSINIGGTVKVMGVGQRLVKGAAHVGGVIVVDGAERIRDVLIPVYRALEIDWDPRTTGALADRAPGLKVSDVADAVRHELGSHFAVTMAQLPKPVVERAAELATGHIPRAA